MRLSTITYGTALAIMLGWLFWMGKPLLLPVLTAIVSLYVLSAAATALSRLPLIGLLPLWALRTLVLIAFATGLFVLFFMLMANFGRVAAAVPGYEENLDRLVARGATMFGIEDEPNWAIVRDNTLGRIDVASYIAPLANQIRGFGTTLFLIVLYAAFFFAERALFADKVTIALGGMQRGKKAVDLVDRINGRISDYLLVKTLVNVVLGLISFGIMWVIGIEFAVFWAVLIGFLNYVPYFGSLIGVLFPVLLSLVQSGSFGFAGLALVTLTVAQVYVGAVLEPRLMGRTFNLSPAVVLLALAFWGALWGIAGAILAVPLTASLVIVLAEIEATRPVAVMLSARGRI
ncbi:AI-2E family transporter [Roseivivax sediminis]|uniref:Predicted PurR-regulated permease PerM n=1 Tax=Roseivivax sediminis TaxID=936889 RepID=A0A1I1ZD49_9RHOB|nr:AI-2E family transporter [Roseivivax sediminis]SFE29637.1 Predicted PurR-regulated permease PerM [Roseivivax sediminis]